MVASAATRAAVPQPARLLGYAGAVPFVAGAAAVWLLDGAWAAFAAPALQAYGAVILSFLGGVHWGLGIGDYGGYGAAGGSTPGRLGASVVPSVVAWVALLLPTGWGFALLALAFVAQLFYDRETAQRRHAPPWYPSLRLPLTAIVVAALLAAAAA